MAHRRPHLLLIAALGLLSLLGAAATASADLVVGSPGSGAGQYGLPQGVGVDTSNGHVYVADEENHRIDVFDEGGAFLFAFGWKVNASMPEERLQTCTTLSGCQAGSAGSGAGQLEAFGPRYLAVDSSSHLVYVGELFNRRVQEFDAEGHFLLAFGKGVNAGNSGKADLCTNAGAPSDVCRAGGEGGGAGQFNVIRGLAVSVAGALYVADSRKIGSCSGNEEFEKRVQRFDSTGQVTQQIFPAENPCGSIQAFAVDLGGNLYWVNGGGIGGIHKYDESGAVATAWGEAGVILPGDGNILALTLDSAGGLFVSDVNFNETEILGFDADGNKTLAFFGNGTLQSRPVALAFHHNAHGDLFASEQGAFEHPARLVQVALPDPGPLLVPGSAKAAPVGNVRATLRVEFNPEGKASSAHFQYVDKESFEAEGGFASSKTQTTPDSPPSPAGFANQAAAAGNLCATPTEATCLKPETTYYFRAVASNADGTVTGERSEFTTLPALQIAATWATDVGTDSARLHAEVNPLGIPATAYFQYIPEGPDYQAHGFENAISLPDPGHPLDFGSGQAPLARAAQAYPLQPGTTYHYRLVAEDPFFAPLISPERAFTTFAALAPGGEGECPANEAFRGGASAALPDCRAYEMVSPLDKDNGDIYTLLNPFGSSTFLDQSSSEGSGFTYSSYRAFADPRSAPYASQLLARRQEGRGWESVSLNPLGSGPELTELLENPFKAFSPDLSSGWLSWKGRPAPDPCAPAGFLQLYRREGGGGFGALSCAAIEHVGSPNLFVPELQGFSADGAHSVFRADEALTANASGATRVEPVLRPIYQLYESSAAGLHLVSVLPDGEASEADSSAGTVGETNVNAAFNFNRRGSLLNAVSADGSRVFWSTAVSGPVGPLYLRLNAEQGQSKIEAGKCTQPARACTLAVSATVSPAPARFQAANPQGTRALFTIESGPLAGNLYEFDAEAEPPTSTLIAEKTIAASSILGASENLSRVYYASTDASAQAQSEGALKGKPNVYLHEAGATRFVATLSSGGGETSDVDNLFGTPISAIPIFRTARVSPADGSLAFMSNSSALSKAVAGYDNTDLAGGLPDFEVYLYDPAAGKLRCVSCNPSGARPSGRVFAKGGNGGAGSWAAAKVPRFQTQLYQPRYLSDDGARLFFDSFEALVLGDTNGKQDVYQWEAAGAGGCGAEAPSYVPTSEGCLSLISSGQSPSDSEFLDASASGSDVFFTTVEGLLPQDYGLIDVYDARVGGGFPPPPNPVPACEGEACQGPLTPPDDPTPASAGFRGAGNVKAEPRRRCAKGKARRKGRCVARHKRPSKSKRGANRDRRTER